MSRPPRARLRHALAVPAGLTLAITGVAGASEVQRQPVELVRTLRLLQDQIGQGMPNAHVAQRALIAEIGRQLLELPVAVWSDLRNARALIAYSLSGGDPKVLRHVLGLGEGLAIDTNLAKGALAYAEQRHAEAIGLLLKVDARSLDPNLAAQVSLVQGILLAKADAELASKKLDDARLLAPGTLIEEAALRREVFLAAEAGLRKKSDALISRYLRRFGKSMYADRFRRELAALFAQPNSPDDPERLAQIENMLAFIEPRERRLLYLVLAKNGITSGRVRLGKFAAEHALRLADEGTADRARARVYEGAALVVTDGIDAGVGNLKGLDRSKVGSRDSELADAAMIIAGEVQRDPQSAVTPASAEDAVRPAPPEATDGAPPDSPSEVAIRAQTMIDSIDEVLKKAVP